MYCPKYFIGIHFFIIYLFIYLFLLFNFLVVLSSWEKRFEHFQLGLIQKLFLFLFLLLLQILKETRGVWSPFQQLLLWIDRRRNQLRWEEKRREEEEFFLKKVFVDFEGEIWGRRREEFGVHFSSFLCGSIEEEINWEEKRRRRSRRRRIFLKFFEIFFVDFEGEIWGRRREEFGVHLSGFLCGSIEGEIQKWKNKNKNKELYFCRFWRKRRTRRDLESGNINIYLSIYLVCNNAGIAGVVGGANTAGLHTGVVVGAAVFVADQDHRDARTEVAIRGEHRKHAEGGDVSGAIRLLLGRWTISPGDSGESEAGGEEHATAVRRDAGYRGTGTLRGER